MQLKCGCNKNCLFKLSSNINASKKIIFDARNSIAGLSLAEKKSYLREKLIGICHFS
jgi:hypothetical protein